MEGHRELAEQITLEFVEVCAVGSDSKVVDLIFGKYVVIARKGPMMKREIIRTTINVSRLFLPPIKTLR